MSRTALTSGSFIAALVALGACSGGEGDNPSNTAGTAGTSTTAGAAGTQQAGGAPNGSGGMTPSAGTGPVGDPTSVCGTSKLGAPLLRRLAARELVRSLQDIFPEAKASWSSALSSDAVSHRGFDNDSHALVVGKQTLAQISDTAKAVADAVTGNALNQLLPCAASSPGAACAGEFLSKYGKRLFRRPLTPAETTEYTTFFTDVGGATDFKRGLAWTLRALIESPQFIYRRELGALSGGARQLTQHEIATEVAYTYTGTTPTDDLLAKADRNELSSPEQLKAVATAMLATPAGKDVIHGFFNATFGYTRVTTYTKTNVPEFSTLRDQMAQETRRFIEEVVLTQGGGPKQLLTAPFTTPSKALATFYGFNTAAAGDYAVMQRPPGTGIGILAQGSILATRALPNSSSPTKRGLMVMEKLLCRVPPVVPPTVPPIPEPQVTTTTRQRYEQQHATGNCVGCHKLFDPMGFAFENFDEVGKFRSMENGHAIDSSGNVLSSAGEVLFEFRGIEELATGLSTQRVVYECISGDVSSYAYGTTESCLAETRRAAFLQGELGFVDYFISLATEPHFVRRDP